MPNRRPSPKIKHRDVVSAQQDLLTWCPNVQGTSGKDLEYTCWACGVRTASRTILCHIERYTPNEVQYPENFILLCSRCHREQPDALPKDAIKYWLATRESHERYSERVGVLFEAATNAAIELLRKEFGALVVKLACEAVQAKMESEREMLNAATESEIASLLRQSESEVECDSVLLRYLGRGAGAGSETRHANLHWVAVAAIQGWCAANRERVDRKMEEVERVLDAHFRNATDNKTPFNRDGAKQMKLFE